jgi:hypothetical protein
LLVDRAHVFRRGGVRAYSNEMREGQWLRPAGLRKAIEIERARPWFSDELAHFHDAVARLRIDLGAELTRDPETVNRDALPFTAGRSANVATIAAPIAAAAATAVESAPTSDQMSAINTVAVCHRVASLWTIDIHPPEVPRATVNARSLVRAQFEDAASDQRQCCGFRSQYG